MHVKSIVSALALSAAFALSGPAFAQTMFNGAELSEADLAIVTERCALLVADAAGGKTTGDSTTGAQASDSEASATDGSTTETAVTDTQATDGAQSTTIDVEAITLEQCTEASLGGAM
jgi:hypothetical protein